MKPQCKLVDYVSNSWMAGYYYNKVYKNFLPIGNALSYQNLHKWSDIELLSSYTLVHRYFPVCRDLNDENSRKYCEGKPFIKECKQTCTGS